MGEWSPIQKLTAYVFGVTLLAIPVKAGLSAVSGSFNDPCIRALDQGISSPLIDEKMWGGKTALEFFSTTALECLESTPAGIVTVPVKDYVMGRLSNLTNPNSQFGQ
jgi:hypothetical protein